MFKKIFIVIFILIVIASSISHAREVPFTQDDRDRLIRLEARVEEGLKAVNQRVDALEKRMEEGFKAVNQRIDGLQNLMYVLIGAIFAQTVGIVGFVIWDRRTALAPAIKKNKELEEREDRVERALKELAKKDDKVAEALKIAGLM